MPGFCIGHIADGPRELAEAVYFSQPAMQWGFLPSRWFVIFTAGTKAGGSCKQINPTDLQPKIIESFIPGPSEE